MRPPSYQLKTARAQQALDRLKARLAANRAWEEARSVLHPPNNQNPLPPDEWSLWPVRVARRCLEERAYLRAMQKLVNTPITLPSQARTQDAGFNPSEPRDRAGKWTRGSGSSSKASGGAVPQHGAAGGGETHPSSAPFAYHITGHRKPPKPAQRQPDQSPPDLSQQFSAHNLGVAAEDTVRAGWAEIHRTLLGIENLVGFVASGGHELDNPVSRALQNHASAGVAAEEKARAERAGHWGSAGSEMVGTALGMLVTMLVGGAGAKTAAEGLRVLMESAKNPAIRALLNWAGATLKGEGMKGAVILNALLSSSLQGGLAGHSWKEDVLGALEGYGGGKALGWAAPKAWDMVRQLVSETFSGPAWQALTQSQKDLLHTLMAKIRLYAEKLEEKSAAADRQEEPKFQTTLPPELALRVETHPRPSFGADAEGAANALAVRVIELAAREGKSPKELGLLEVWTADGKLVKAITLRGKAGQYLKDVQEVRAHPMEDWVYATDPKILEQIAKTVPDKEFQRSFNLARNEHALAVGCLGARSSAETLGVKVPLRLIKNPDEVFKGQFERIEQLKEHAPEDYKALEDYTGEKFEDINGSSMANTPTEEAQRAERAVEATMQPLPEGTVVSRAMSLEPAQITDLERGADVSAIHESQHLMSTSIEPGKFPGNVQLKMVMGPGVKGTYVAKHSQFSEEAEVILPKGTRYIIQKVIKSTVVDKEGFGGEGKVVVEVLVLPN